MIGRGLYALTPDWDDTRRMVETSARILDAGCRLLQYRHKRADITQRTAQAAALRALTRRHGALLIINDDVDLALACEADGVHLGADDGDLAQARARLDAAHSGNGLVAEGRCGVNGHGASSSHCAEQRSAMAVRILGATCYQSIERAREAATAGADYLAFGSFHASASKPGARRAQPALLEAAKAATGLPLCAIGGITPARAPALIEAGADLLAVISALYDADDAFRAARQFVQFFEEHA